MRQCRNFHRDLFPVLNPVGTLRRYGRRIPLPMPLHAGVFDDLNALSFYSYSRGVVSVVLQLNYT